MDTQKQNLWLEQRVIFISMLNAGDKVLVSVLFDNEESINLSAAEIMELTQQGKISVENIDMLQAMREEFLAYFPLIVK